jgi:hypothetical protein
VGALARSGELTGRIGAFLLRFGLAAPLGGGNRTINGGDSASNGSLGGTGLFPAKMLWIPQGRRANVLKTEDWFNPLL